MARWTVALGALLALLAVSASATRVPNSLLQEVHDGFASLGSPLTGSQSNFGAFWRSVARLGREKRVEEGENAYMSIRFHVLPADSDEFEDAWLKCQREAYKEESGVQLYTLHKFLLDNLHYSLYGEFDEMRDLVDFLQSDHFQDFVDFVDDRNVRWELHLLENVSEDVEEEQGLRDSRGSRRREVEEELKRRERGKSEEGWDKNIPEEYRKYIPKQYLPRQGRKEVQGDFEVLYEYIVPPDVKEDFESDWVDAAFKTLKEDGNTAITLRKLRTDNTRYFGYGRWDSLEDFTDHYFSRHMGRLSDSFAKNEVIVFRYPVELVEEEGEEEK